MESLEIKRSSVDPARPFTMDDLEAVIALRLHAITTEPNAFGRSAHLEKQRTMEEWKAQYFSAIGEHPSTVLDVVMNEGRAVGMLGAVPDEGENVWKLIRMYVLPEFRGKGLADDLFQAVETAVRNAGGTKLILDVNSGHPAAVGLYEKHGMVRTAVNHLQRSDGSEFDKCRYEKSLV